MQKILYHLALEPYRTRYTEYLKKIEQEAFTRYFEVKDIPGPDQQAAVQISTGEVLDAVNRPLFALEQVRNLLAQSNDGLVYCSDFYTPGIDALAYSRRGYRVATFNWAQTFDVYDFTAQLEWMRGYEEMCLDIYEWVFVATEYQKNLMYARDKRWSIKTVAVGLPFDAATILEIAAQPYIPLAQRQYDMVYSSRLDNEKRASVFAHVIERANFKYKFALCTGFPDLKGTDAAAIKRLKDLQSKGALDIYTNCTKQEYFRILNNSRLQLNTALQDWVSFTLLEALTMGCIPVYPNWRAFPEVLGDIVTLYPFGYPEDILGLMPEYLKITQAEQNILKQHVLNKYGSAQHKIAKILHQAI